jgi:hypothetical protein
MAVPGLCLPAHLLIVTLNLLLLQAPMYTPRHSFSRRLPKRLCPRLPPTHPLIEGSVDLYRHPPRRMPCVPGPAPRPMLSRVFKLTSNVPALRKAYRCAVRDDQAATALIDMAPDSHPIFRSEYMLTGVDKRSIWEILDRETP